MKLDPARVQLSQYPVRVDIPIRYGDLDAQAHVNNVAIAEYYQEARVVFHQGWAAHERAAGSRGLVAHHAMDYLAEISYPGQIVVGVRVAQVGRTSYTLHTGLFQEGRCVGVASTVMVHAVSTGPSDVPPGMRAYLERFSGAPAA